MMDKLLAPGAFLAFAAALFWYGRVLTRVDRDLDVALPLRARIVGQRPSPDLGKTGNVVASMWVSGFVIIFTGMAIGSIIGHVRAGVITACVATVATWLIAAIWLRRRPRP
jgi:hypothetical protein